MATSINPRTGQLLTFAQFALVSLVGLPKQLIVQPREGPQVIGRQNVLREVQDNIVHKRMHRGAPTRVAVQEEGARGWADALAKELESSGCVTNRLSAEVEEGQEVVSLLSKLSGPGIPDDAIVIVDGTRLQSRQLRDRWHLVMYLGTDAALDTSLASAPSLTVNLKDKEPSLSLPAPEVRGFIEKLSRIRFRPRQIPLSRWAVQVILFLITSLLNNQAFAYNIPMAVHIIFRSGGLVVNMVMGRFINKRRYSALQIISVIVVTTGVVLTTLSSSNSTKSAVSAANTVVSDYYVGIVLLALALVLSGALGMVQDRTYAKYGRGHWQEALFYLHFLAMPGFAFVWDDILNQLRVVNNSARIGLSTANFFSATTASSSQWRVSFPAFYLPLAVNIITQLLCVSGVHRLTSRVSSLTVTLVLVVRKAVSLGISVLLLGRTGGGFMLWTGAVLVLGGSVIYAVGSTGSDRPKTKRQ